MRTLYIDCGMGAAGDMLTAALLALLEEKRQADFLREINEALAGKAVVSAAPTSNAAYRACTSRSPSTGTRRGRSCATITTTPPSGKSGTF